MNNNPIVKQLSIVIGLVVALFVAGKFLAPKDPPLPLPPTSAGAEGKKAENISPPDGSKATLGSKAVTSPTGLKYEDQLVGTGKEAKDGSSIAVHYTGWLTNGTQFDSSRTRGEPYALTLPGQVINGWNQGIPGMKVGGKRKLVIPPDLGYGDQGQGADIPPGATLVFELELMKVD